MKHVFFSLLLFASFSIYAQKASKKDKKEKEPVDEFTSTEYKVDSIEKDIFNPDVVFEEVKKKKPKKRVFYGLKTARGFTKVGGATNQVIELFHYLKEYREPNSYVQDIYWYSTKERRIKKSNQIDKENARILHGPYMKIVNEDTVEEGNYYIGTKHGRWSNYKKNYILSDKNSWHKGWPKDAEISYYDNNQKKIKEVIPRRFGMLDGDYYSFYENGLLKEEGQYKYGVKTGRWVEYHKLKRKRKAETQYTKDPYDKNFQPYKLYEWDERGTMTYDHEKEKKSLSTKKQ